MQEELFNKNGSVEDKIKEKFTKLELNEMVIEVDKFDYDGLEVVRPEFFAKLNSPAVTLKDGKISFNVRAIRKLDECSHILFMIDMNKRLLVIEPSDENDRNSIQWSKVDKRGKVVPRTITGRPFTGMLYTNMNWNSECTMKILGGMAQEVPSGKKRFVFNLINAEAYLHLAEPSADDPNRHERVPHIRHHFMPKHWEGHFGQSYEESKKPLIDIFDGMDGFVKVTFPKAASKKRTSDGVMEMTNLLEQIVASDADKSKDNVEE